jgi:hypothetical protein
MTVFELARLLYDLKLAGLDPKIWMPRIRLGANACDVFARSVPDNEDYFRRVDGRAPEDCWCYVRLVPPGPETMCSHPALGPRDGWTAVLDACCYLHQTAAADWQGCSRLGFRLTTNTSRPAALEAAAGVLDKIGESDIDEWAVDVSDDDEPFDGVWTIGEPAVDEMPARFRCLPGFECDPRRVCLPCEEDIGAERYAFFLLTADNQKPVHLCRECAEIAHAIIERPTTLQEYDRFDWPLVSGSVRQNGNPKPGASVWRLPYPE